MPPSFCWFHGAHIFLPDTRAWDCPTESTAQFWPSQDSVPPGAVRLRTFPWRSFGDYWKEGLDEEQSSREVFCLGLSLAIRRKSDRNNCCLIFVRTLLHPCVAAALNRHRRMHTAGSRLVLLSDRDRKGFMESLSSADRRSRVEPGCLPFQQTPRCYSRTVSVHSLSSEFLVHLRVDWRRWGWWVHSGPYPVGCLPSHSPWRPRILKLCSTGLSPASSSWI